MKTPIPLSQADATLQEQGHRWLDDLGRRYPPSFSVFTIQSGLPRAYDGLGVAVTATTDPEVTFDFDVANMRDTLSVSPLSFQVTNVRVSFACTDRCFVVAGVRIHGDQDKTAVWGHFF